MKVCHVCSAHPADDSRVLHRMCASLAAEGYEVHLFAVSESKKSYQTQGVIVHPLPMCSGRRQRFGRRFRVAEMAADLKPDVFHVHEPELLGSMIRYAASQPVIYDVHESYLDILTEREWLPSAVKPLARLAWDWRERRLIPRCAAVVTATDHIALRYIPMHQRVVAIRNFTDVSFGAAEAVLAKRDGCTCILAGTIQPSANLANTIKAMAILRKRGVNSRLWFAGRIAESYKNELLALACREGLSKEIKYFGVLSRTEAISLQASASIGLVNFLPTPNIVHSVPIRMLECMTLGLPLVYSKFPAFEKIAGAYGAGIAVDPYNADQIADAMELLIRNYEVAQQMGQAGVRAVREQFNWQNEQTKLSELYKCILRQH